MHYSVLLSESIEGLNVREDGIYIDATLGYAGHSSVLLARLKRGFLFAFDNDIDAIKEADKKLSQINNNYKIFHENFSTIPEVLKDKKIDGILFDLGMSSVQIDNADRGFSFMHDGLLDMRMNQDSKLTAEYVVNSYSEEKLIDLFYKYGEEPRSKIIASKIVLERKTRRITRTLELVEIIKNSVGSNYFYNKHPERNIFQAIRIEVNNELKVLENVLPKVIDMLNIGGRISVITFHSLEDKIVKSIFKKYSEVDEVYKGMPNIPEEYKPKIKIINKKPIMASEKELKENSRSRSAKLRIVERI